MIYWLEWNVFNVCCPILVSNSLSVNGDEFGAKCYSIIIICFKQFAYHYRRVTLLKGLLHLLIVSSSLLRFFLFLLFIFTSNSCFVYVSLEWRERKSFTQLMERLVDVFMIVRLRCFDQASTNERVSGMSIPTAEWFDACLNVFKTCVAICSARLFGLLETSQTYASEKLNEINIIESYCILFTLWWFARLRNICWLIETVCDCLLGDFSTKVEISRLKSV